MNASLAVVCLTLVVQLATGQYQFACQPNFCSAFVGPCDREASCEDGRVIRNATQCGCCDICVKTLKKGEACINTELASIPRTECGAGLVCVKGTCVPGDTLCMRHQLLYDKERYLQDLSFSRPRPECDDFGDYKPMSCKEGMLCFCLDKNGNRIFGTALSKYNASMNCNCSRDFHEFRGRMRRADQFLQCQENGNYDPMQCTDDYCYCIGDEGRLDGRPVHVNSSIAKLKCYDFERHEKGIKSKCWRERDAVEERIREYLEKDVTVIGIDVPECELDGSYSPVRCKEDYCLCLSKDGNPIIHTGSSDATYKVERNSELARNMNCRCAREKELLHQVESKNLVTFLFSQFKCLPNGNYQPFQCVDSKCFCVDDMGFQHSISVPESAKHFLDCYEQ